MIKKSIIYKFVKDFTKHRKKTNRAVGFLHKHFLNMRPMRPSNNLENKIPPDTYCRVQVVQIKVLVNNSLEPPLEYNQNQMPLTNQVSDDLFKKLES